MTASRMMGFLPLKGFDFDCWAVPYTFDGGLARGSENWFTQRREDPASLSSPSDIEMVSSRPRACA